MSPCHPSITLSPQCHHCLPSTIMLLQCHPVPLVLPSPPSTTIMSPKMPHQPSATMSSQIHHCPPSASIMFFQYHQLNLVPTICTLMPHHPSDTIRSPLKPHHSSATIMSSQRHHITPVPPWLYLVLLPHHSSATTFHSVPPYDPTASNMSPLAPHHLGWTEVEDHRDQQNR